MGFVMELWSEYFTALFDLLVLACSFPVPCHLRVPSLYIILSRFLLFTSLWGGIGETLISLISWLSNNSGHTCPNLISVITNSGHCRVKACQTPAALGRLRQKDCNCKSVARPGCTLIIHLFKKWAEGIAQGLGTCPHCVRPCAWFLAPGRKKKHLQQ